MIGLDLAQCPSEITRVLLLRGAGIPPLSWGDEPHRGAKKLLDEVDDARLFGSALADDAMAAAVRAALYLWSGWVGECVMFSQAAPEQERLYLKGLCERHNGQMDASKAAFREMGKHAIRMALGSYAISALAESNDAAVARFQQQLLLDPAWEPFLFADLYQQAKAGVLRSSGEQVVRSLQCREFELLLVHCLEAATGCPFTSRRAASASESEQQARDRERKLREQRRERERRQRQTQEAMRHSKEPPKPAADKPGLLASAERSTSAGKPADQIRIRCPKCGEVQAVGAASRGKICHCRCGAGFMVPKGDSAHAGGAPSGAAMISVLCPKCGKPLSLSPTARGKPHQCAHCKTTFLVPKAQPAAAR